MKSQENGLLSFWEKGLITLLMVLAFLFPEKVKAQVAKGADVGWLSYFENSKGIEYINDSGQVQDAIAILKDHGLNAIRFRAFVDPTLESIGEVDTEGVVKNAVRANNLGMDVMITIHYSDEWADPGDQHKPLAWENLSFNQLSQAVFDYTYSLMDALLIAGVTPKWVQVGNETNPGFLWPDGALQSSNGFANMDKFVVLSNRGYEAIKERSPSTKVITHLSSGNKTSFFQNFFDAFYAKGGKNDIIGMSYYPRWNGGSIQEVGQNMNNLASRFDKDVMICEIGNWESEPVITYNMVVDAINAVKAVPNGHGLGVFYWEPIAAQSINAYQQGLALPISENQYQFSWVLDCFLEGALNCSPQSVTPWFQLDNGDWVQESIAIAFEGGSIKLSPHPEEGGTWSWRGPEGFFADTRAIELADLQRNQAGNYIATYIPSEGCPADQTFTLCVYEAGEIIIGNPGFETGELAPWIATGQTGVSGDLKASGDFSGWFGGGNAALKQNVSGLLPNTNYELSCYVRNWSGDDGVVTVGVKDYGGLEITREVGMTPNNGDDFVLTTVNFTTGSIDTTALIFSSTSKARTWGKLDDVRILSLGLSVSTEDIINNGATGPLSFFPNPASNKIFISSKTNIEDVNLVIYNLQGKQVLSKKLDNLYSAAFPMSVSQLPEGAYIIKFFSKSNLINAQKLLIK